LSENAKPLKIEIASIVPEEFEKRNIPAGPPVHRSPHGIFVAMAEMAEKQKKMAAKKRKKKQ
jgi:hypothetical protein